MNDSKVFNVTCVACESLAVNFKVEVSSKDVCSFLNDHHIKCIDSFNPTTGKHLDLKQFNPDYIFVSTPYDIYRPDVYSSDNLSKICKLCDIEYGANSYYGDDIESFIINNPYYDNCYMHFITGNKQNYISDRFNDNPINKKFISVGGMKVEKYFEHTFKPGKWGRLFGHSDSLRIVWKPRWTIENVDIFMNWLKAIIDFTTKENVQLLILEHPLLLYSLKEKKALEEYEKLLGHYKNDNIKTFNDYDFLDYVIEADALICEPTSLISEFSITNNTVIVRGLYSQLNDMAKKLLRKAIVF